MADQFQMCSGTDPFKRHPRIFYDGFHCPLCDAQREIDLLQRAVDRTRKVLTDCRICYQHAARAALDNAEEKEGK